MSLSLPRLLPLSLLSSHSLRFRSRRRSLSSRRTREPAAASMFLIFSFRYLGLSEISEINARRRRPSSFRSEGEKKKNETKRKEKKGKRKKETKQGRKKNVSTYCSKVLTSSCRHYHRLILAYTYPRRIDLFDRSRHD